MTHSPGPEDSTPTIELGVTAIPAALSGQSRRQASAAITGYVYQAWRSIDAWLRLRPSGAVIYLEGAEDYDEVEHDLAIATQVRHTAEPISLGSAKARQALESFWALAESETDRRVEYHYLTTSSIGSERGLSIGTPGIAAWNAARTNPAIAAELTTFLLSELPSSSRLRAFLDDAEIPQAQEMLFRRFQWLTDQPGIEKMRSAVEARLTALLSPQQRPVRFVGLVSNALFDFFWETARNGAAAERRLSPSDLDRIISEVAEVEVSTLARDFGPLANAFSSERSLLEYFTRRVPVPPEPLLRRPALIERVQVVVRDRKVALLTGTVHKGKTTLAQLAAAALCPEAQWVMLAGQSPSAIDRLLTALADVIDQGQSPALVILDDLDVSPAAHRIYRWALAFCLQRASAVGVSVIITAQGTSSSTMAPEDFSALNLLDVPDLDHDEVMQLCLEHGCGESFSSTWATLILVGTGGHPAFVRVRISELVSRAWPRPELDDVMGRSPGVTTVRERARHLLRDTVDAPTAELMYAMSEANVPLVREVAVRLAASVPGISMPGDAVDAQIGKWLERVEEGGLRTTALLRHTAGDVWTPDQQRANHVRIFQALIPKQPSTPAEAASLLFHSFLARDSARQTVIAQRLLTVENEEARHQVEQHLMWLTAIALAPGETFTDFAGTDILLRQLQFNVAATVESDGMSDICARWAEALEQIPLDAGGYELRSMMWMQLAMSQDRRVSIRMRLDALDGLRTASDEAATTWRTGIVERFLRNSRPIGLPESATPSQIILIAAARVVRSLESLIDLTEWLESRASTESRVEFEQMIEWGLVQTSGAFIQGAWAAKHEDTTNWSEWLLLFDRIRTYSIANNSPSFGREAAKAKAIVLSEHCAQPQAAVEAIAQAVTDFGFSAVLEEQSVNTLFQSQDYAGALAIYRRARENGLSTAWDPFARRRAGLSAVRLESWTDAEEIFREAADSIIAGSFEPTRVGLYFDAAAVASRGAIHSVAVANVCAGLDALPPPESTEGDATWEAVLRASITIVSDVKARIWKPLQQASMLEPGRASQPGLNFGVTPGHNFRIRYLQANTLALAASVQGLSPHHESLLEPLGASDYPIVRYAAAVAGFSQSIARGAVTGFVSTLISLDIQFSGIAALGTQVTEASLISPAQAETMSPAPERHFPLIAAGVVCTGPHLQEAIRLWTFDAITLLGASSPMIELLAQFSAGADADECQLAQLAWDSQGPNAIRCSAAARKLWLTENVEEGFRLQTLLLTAVTAGDSESAQAMYGRHIAKVWSAWWNSRLQSGRFQFRTNAITALEHVLSAIERGEGSLRDLRAASAAACGGVLNRVDGLLI